MPFSHMMVNFSDQFNKNASLGKLMPNQKTEINGRWMAPNHHMLNSSSEAKLECAKERRLR
jgi:hypothetical protein